MLAKQSREKLMFRTYVHHVIWSTISSVGRVPDLIANPAGLNLIRGADPRWCVLE